MKTDPSFALLHPQISTTFKQKLGQVLILLSLVMLILVWISGKAISPALQLILCLSMASVGSYWYISETYRYQPIGIKNNNNFKRGLTSRGGQGWLLAFLLTAFYTCLYWFPERMTGLIQLFNPLSQFLRKYPADHWFVYGTFYTFLIIVMGFKMILKYRHNRYQIFRTISVAFFQLAFAYFIPALLISLQQPEVYLHYFWPLSYYQGTPMAYSYYTSIAPMTKLGVIYFWFGIAMFVVGTPVLTYFFGKRWYCSWVCGCGGLAETAGDPFRHLSNKSLKAWRIERYLIYSILIFVVFVTVLLWVNVFTHQSIFFNYSERLYKTYSFFIGAMFSGVIGVGFYPLLGSRVWCRFGCPMAAWLGIWQRYFSRFRITTNGGQCISCGNCSTYCEMGIDVKAYAQNGQDILRASCVGCGVCAAVCPRGVLKLENKKLCTAETIQSLK